MKFRVEQPVFHGIGLARELGKVWGRSRRKTLLGTVQFLFGILTLAAGLFCMVGIVAGLGELNGEGALAVTWTGIVLNLLMILLGLFWTGWGKTLNGSLMLWSLRKAVGDTRFYQDHLDDVSEGICVSYQYQKIRAVFEGKRAFYLQVAQDRFTVLVLQKTYFTLGEPDAFRRFMDEQCGKPVIAV